MRVESAINGFLWLNRYGGVLFSLVLGSVALSCPSAKVRVVEVDTSSVAGGPDQASKSMSVGDEPAGADAGKDDLWPDERPGTEIPLAQEPLDHFFAALHGLESGKIERVRVVHYGDSHTAADIFTTAVRRALQTRFGDGGRGFILLGRPWRSYRPKDIDLEVTGHWSTERILVAADPVTLDGYYGLGGISVATRDVFARSIVSTTNATGFGRTAGLFDVYYLAQPHGGRFSVYVDGKLKGTVDTASAQKRSGFFKVEVDDAPHQFEVRTKGDGEVRLFGAVVESGHKGVVYDALGVNGGFFYTPLRWNETAVEVQLKRRNPQLLVTMYGTNEVGSKVLQPDVYKARISRVMDRFLAGIPSASCLMLGPPDRVVSPEKEFQLRWIIEVQQEVAVEKGCAFVNLRELMGGAGTHQIWQSLNPPYAQADGVHLTVKGYLALGERVAGMLIDAYDQYTANR